MQRLLTWSISPPPKKAQLCSRMLYAAMLNRQHLEAILPSHFIHTQEKLQHSHQLQSIGSSYLCPVHKGFKQKKPQNPPPTQGKKKASILPILVMSNCNECFQQGEYCILSWRESTICFLEIKLIAQGYKECLWKVEETELKPYSKCQPVCWLLSKTWGGRGACSAE